MPSSDVILQSTCMVPHTSNAKEETNYFFL